MKNNPLIIRVDESKKIEFKVALLRQRVSMQAVIEAFIDSLVSYDKGEKNPYLDKLLKRAQSE